MNEEMYNSTYEVEEKDPRLEEVAKLINGHSTVPTGLIQRHFNIGYTSNDRIFRQLEALGIIGPLEKHGPEGGDWPYARLVLVNSRQMDEILSQVPDRIILKPSVKFATLPEFEDVAREVVRSQKADRAFFKHLSENVLFFSRSRINELQQELVRARITRWNTNGFYEILIKDNSELETLLCKIRSNKYTPLPYDVIDYSSRPSKTIVSGDSKSSNKKQTEANAIDTELRPDAKVLAKYILKQYRSYQNDVYHSPDAWEKFLPQFMDRHYLNEIEKLLESRHILVWDGGWKRLNKSLFQHCSLKQLENIIDQKTSVEEVINSFSQKNASSSLDEKMGEIMSVFKIIMFIICLPFVLAYYEFLIMYYLFVGIPCYLIKLVFPKTEQSLEALFEKGLDAMHNLAEWYWNLFFSD